LPGPPFPQIFFSLCGNLCFIFAPHSKHFVGSFCVAVLFFDACPFLLSARLACVADAFFFLHLFSFPLDRTQTKLASFSLFLKRLIHEDSAHLMSFFFRFFFRHLFWKPVLRFGLLSVGRLQSFFFFWCGFRLKRFGPSLVGFFWRRLFFSIKLSAGSVAGRQLAVFFFSPHICPQGVFFFTFCSSLASFTW